MLRFSLSVFLFIYLLPVLLLYSEKYTFEIFQLFTIYLAYAVGVLGSLVLCKGRDIVNHSQRFRVDNKVFYILFTVYIICKLPDLIELFQVVISGDFAQWALNKALNRYENFEEVSQVSFFQRLGTISFIMSGTIIASLRGNKKWPFILMFIMVFNESASLARLGVLLVFCSAVVETVIRKNALIQKIKLSRLLKYYFLIFITLISIFAFSAYFRVSAHDDAFEIVIQKLGIYTVAMYEALFIWMRDNSQNYAEGFGFYSFAGVYKIFGSEVQQGFYGLAPTRFGDTNIYTSIRGYLSDCGLIGTAILFCFVGFFSTVYCYRKISIFSYNVLRIVYFMFVFCLFSPFIHFNTLAAYILAGLVCSLLPINFFNMRNRNNK